MTARSTLRPTLRLLRWTGLAAVAPVLWACNARTLEAPVLKPETTFSKTFQASINRNVDLLFLVDDSSSMTNSQTNLLNNFPDFMTELKKPPGLPNIHVAVVSSDMGAGDACNSTTNKNGIFQYSRRGTCAATNLAAGATFISDIAGTRNYTGNLEDVFTCIAALGEGGCGFEHQFAAITRALGADGRAAPIENQGFLRPEAYLAIILITNEDDCSASPGLPLFDFSQNRDLMSELGPLKNFRCNEFGHLCSTGGGAPMHLVRSAPGNDLAATVSYDNCTSNDTEGYLLSVVDTANRIKELKADPSQVLVAAITGPSTPYAVHWKAPDNGDTSCGAASCPWPVITNSCTANDGSFADPGVRVNEFVDQFGANGLKLSICDSSFAPSLQRIGELINDTLKPPCIPGTVANKPNMQSPDCTVVSHTPNGTGGFVDATVPACADNGNTAPCWSLEAGACASGGNGQVVRLATDPNLPPASTQNATVNCALCVAGTPDPARGCP